MKQMSRIQVRENLVQTKILDFHSVHQLTKVGGINS